MKPVGRLTEIGFSILSRTVRLHRHTPDNLGIEAQHPSWFHARSAQTATPREHGRCVLTWISSGATNIRPGRTRDHRLTYSSPRS